VLPAQTVVPSSSVAPRSLLCSLEHVIESSILGSIRQARKDAQIAKDAQFYNNAQTIQCGYCTNKGLR